MAPFKSGGGVLCIAALEFVVGLALLGVFEGFKSHYFRAVFGMWSEAEKNAHKELPAAARSLNFKSPLDILFWFAVANNICSIFGLAGVLAAQRELVTIFFAYNAVQVVLSFSIFVDTATDVGIRFAGEPAGLTGYEQAAAALIFINFVLAIAATIFAVKAVDELKVKQREEYNRLGVMSDTLAFEMDGGPT